MRFWRKNAHQNACTLNHNFHTRGLSFELIFFLIIGIFRLGDILTYFQQWQGHRLKWEHPRDVFKTRNCTAISLQFCDPERIWGRVKNNSIRNFHGTIESHFIQTWKYHDSGAANAHLVRYPYVFLDKTRRSGKV